MVFRRPDDDDREDPLRLTQTFLEQIAANKRIRAIAEFLRETRYVHLVPQIRDLDLKRDEMGIPHLEAIYEHWRPNNVGRQLAPLIYRVANESRRNPQIIVTTHSPDLLDDGGIAASEILLLSPTSEGTRAQTTADIPEIRALLESGLSPAEVVVPASAPDGASNSRDSRSR